MSSESEGSTMVAIRLKKVEWAEAWRAMVEIAPVRLVRDDPVYEVEPAHLELLTRRGFSYEIVPEPKRKPESRRHGTAD
jgi:hypothetical protein